MFKQRWKPVQFVVGIAIVSTMTSGCWGPHGDHERPDRVGRGCPIPHGDEITGPTDGKFLEIYSPHVYTRNTVILDITPWGSDAALSIEGKSAPALKRDTRYILLFTNGRAKSRVQLREWNTTNFLVDRDTERLLPSKGDPNVKGYKYPGMTIYSADADTLAFGLRVNGLSLPIKISQ